MNAYFDQMILSASPVELIRLLFQRAIAKVREARVHLKENRIEERSAAITAAYKAIAELLNSIHAEAAPDLSARLRALYCYVQERLLVANLKQKDEPLLEVLGVLTTLSEAWISVPDSSANSMTKQIKWVSGAVIADEANSINLSA